MKFVDCSVRYTSDDFDMVGLLNTMDLFDVEKAVLISEMDHGISNHTKFLTLAQTHADRFALVPKVSYKSKQVEEEIRFYQEQNIHAIKIDSIGHFSDPLEFITVEKISSFTVWEGAAKYNMAIFTRPNVWDAKLLPYLVLAYPGTEVFIESSMISTSNDYTYLDEYGRPRLSLPIPTMDRYTFCGLRDCKNVTLVLSSEYALSRLEWPYRDLNGWHSLGNIIWLFGASRLVWGSDYPFTIKVPGYEKCIKLTRERMPDMKESVYQKIMGGAAAQKLFAKR